MSFTLVCTRKLLKSPAAAVVHLGERHFHINRCLASTNVAFRQARFLKKLMTGSNRSRKKFFNVEQPVSKSLKEFSAVKGVGGGTPTKSNKCLRRVEVLNTLFMEQITSLMSTGDASPEILGLGITVSRVKISNDFSRVNIYWIATGTDKDETIEPLLRKAGGILRHELSQLRVIGIVPPIEFVKDKTYSKIMEVQTLLEKCDFGEDFMPTPARQFFVQTSQLSTKFSRPTLSEIATEIEIEEEEEKFRVDKTNDITTETDLYKSTPMRQDMLGLRHDVMMLEIKQILNKVKGKQKTKEETNITSTLGETKEKDLPMTKVEHTEADSLMEITKSQIAADKERKDEFLKYLRKQQLVKARELKRNSTEFKEKEFYDNEAYERWKMRVFGEDFENRDEEDDDYVEYDENYYFQNESRK